MIAMLWLLNRTPPPPSPTNQGCSGVIANQTSATCAINQVLSILPFLISIMAMLLIISVVLRVVGDFGEIKHEEEEQETIDLSVKRGPIWRLVHWLFYRRKEREEEGEPKE